ncbi:MAG: trigger factor [Pirellulales bacterium]
MAESKSDSPADADAVGVAEQEEQSQRLELEVSIASPTACERKITVTVPRADIDRYFNKAFGEMMPSAAVPGFRAGRAPRKLVEARYRKEVAPQVKGSLLLDSITQVTDDQKLAPISEPEFDLDAIELPDDGPMVFEYKLEVRPEFDLPEWRGLSLEKPVRDFDAKDVQRRRDALLAQHGRLVPKDGPAVAGDYLSTNLAFYEGDTLISESKEEVIRIRPILSFRDGRITDFDKLMKGVKAGETRDVNADISSDAPNAALRGKKVRAVFEVLEVKQLELPEITPQLLDELGGFETEEELNAAVKADLERQLTYHQGQRARQQVTALLTQAAGWDLPPDLLRRQSQRELERAVLELRRSGFSDQEIRAHSNDLRQNSMANTARALKEHFILERIAESEKIEDEPGDYDQEIELIAAQSGESVRRVRAQLEKRGLFDVLRNQIVERKVLELIYSQAKFKEVPFQPEASETEAVDQSATGEEPESDIPEVKSADSAEGGDRGPDREAR